MLPIQNRHASAPPSSIVSPDNIISLAEDTMPEDQAKSDQPELRMDTQAASQVPEMAPVQREELMRTLIKGQNNSILTASELPFGTVGTATTYRVLPARLADSAQGHTIKWRIELHGLSRDLGPIGVDIVGDVTLGRGGGSSGGPDLDLDPFGAFDTGVSRQHVMLRPSRHALYLIDLKSTNGTWHNALRLGSGTTRTLANNDTITLGRLTFTVRLISLPPQPRLQDLHELADDKDMSPPSEPPNGKS
jgi:hypothetical protein